MSTHLPLQEFYRIIEEGDLLGAQRAMLFLGARIHVMKIWRSLTPMLYAGKLGHFGVAGILLEDFQRFEDVDASRFQQTVKLLFEEAIPKRNKDPSFLRELVKRYANWSWNVFIFHLVEEEEFDLIGELARKAPDKFIPVIVDTCMRKGKRQVFYLPGWIRNHEKYLFQVFEAFVGDALFHCIMANDTPGKMMELLRQFFKDPSKFRILSASVFYKPLSSSCLVESEIPHFGYIEAIIKTDDAKLLNKVVSGENLTRALSLAKLPKDQLFEAILDIALRYQSTNIISALLKGSRVKKHRINWSMVYYRSLKCGHLKAASTIKRESVLFSTAPRLQDLLTSQEFADKPVAVITNLANEITAYLKRHASLDQRLAFKEHLRAYPRRYGRPDLIKAFEPCGIRYTQADVILYLNNQDNYNRFVTKLNRWDVADSDLTGIDEMTPQTLAELFFRGHILTIDLDALGCDMEDKCRLLLKPCVMESGKKMVASSRDNDDSEENNSLIEFVNETERQRRKAMNLQKLCRMFLRSHIRQANLGKSLTDTIASLHLDGHLGSQSVKYLLFRETETSCSSEETPLFYRLNRLYD